MPVPNSPQPVLSVDLTRGAVVLYDERIKFTAGVNDGRQVKQIDFYVDGVFKQGIIAAPYEYTWNSGASRTSDGTRWRCGRPM